MKSYMHFWTYQFYFFPLHLHSLGICGVSSSLRARTLIKSDWITHNCILGVFENQPQRLHFIPLDQINHLAFTEGSLSAWLYARLSGDRGLKKKKGIPKELAECCLRALKRTERKLTQFVQLVLL